MLDNPTFNPPLAAGALKATAHSSVPAPVSDALLQVNALSVPAGGGVPLSLFSCKVKLLETVPALAIRVADCAELTAVTLAMKAALVAFAGTVTVEGTLTAALFVNRLTFNPADADGAFRVIVQRSVPAPVIDALLQVSALNVAEPIGGTLGVVGGLGGAVDALDVPIPLSAMTAVLPVDELLLTVNCPVWVPAATGLNCTLTV